MWLDEREGRTGKSLSQGFCGERELEWGSMGMVGPTACEHRPVRPHNVPAAVKLVSNGPSLSSALS